jgi:polyisoprenoid-binding protein YceI
MKNLFRFLTICLMLSFPSAGYASQWSVDPDHSEIRFEVKHILTDVSGQFADFTGDIVFDPENPGAGKFDFTVGVKSVDTNNGKRDNHLRSKDFFDADKFPKMTFESTGIAHLKDNLYTLNGLMTIKDVIKTMTVTFEFFKPVPHPFDKKKNVAGFRTIFEIPRLDYAVGSGKFLEMGVVGEMVAVEITIEALTPR